MRGIIDLLADRFPGIPCRPWTPPALFFFDTRDQNDVLGKVAARMHWCCPDLIRSNRSTGGRVQAYWHHAPSPACPRICRPSYRSPYRRTVSATAAQWLPRAEGYRLNLLPLP
ncbi:hypothetical protein HTV80_03450 [Streptomyces sp. Vc74B-19]|uniref:hypothetical protein n=1 Tax=Streptomyces sp. Vc74B-19 TaxID=2741324 RepID=UPI001BFC82B2|nr:hypothetical protein [Streptomyces sp. Vc74B-19]MBT3162168.1 hypothetical protein [Streptomyces sp. Vc74B-19]